MRTFILAVFVLAGALGSPLFAGAASRCDYEGQSCTLDNNSVGICSSNPGCPLDGSDPTCDANICVANQSGRTTGPNSGGGQSGGAGPNGTNITLINPLGAGTSLMSFLLSILGIITNVIGPIIVILMLVYVGFKFVAAQGNESKITEAKQMLLWTVIGALILLGAAVIAQGIQATVQALSTGR